MGEGFVNVCQGTSYVSGAHLRCNCWTLHPIEDIADLLEVGDMGAVRIQGRFPVCTFR